MTSPSDARPEELLAHDAWLRALVRNLLDREDQVDDVVQSTWMAASQHPSRPFRERAWLGAVARNLARRARRDLGRRARRERRAARPEADPGGEVDPLEELNEQRRIIGAVTRLPEPYRTTILLRYYRDLPMEEIAERTRTSAANVRQRLRRGRALLRQELATDYGDGWRRSPLLLALADPRPVAKAGAAGGLAGDPSQLSGLLTLIMSKPAAACLSVLLALLFVWVLWPAPEGAPSPHATGPGSTADTAGDLDVAGAGSARDDGTPPARAESSVPEAQELLDRPRELGTLLVSVSLEDGRPAPRFPVTVSGRDGAGEHTHRHLTVTDALGRALFQRIESGRWNVTLGRAAVEQVVVPPAERTELELSIPVGITARVQVVDAGGVPVPNAMVRLWLAGPLGDVPHAEPGAPVGRTDAQGRLTLVGVPTYYGNRSWIAAEHPRLGASPARLVHVDGDGALGESSVGEIELALGAGGVGLRCSVVDSEGLAVSGAAVELQPVDEPASIVVGPGRWDRVTEFVTRATSTDVQGRARMRPFPAGTWDLRVQHPDHGLHRQRLQVGHSPLDVTVTLVAPARLQVRVIDETGEVVAAAPVNIRVTEQRFRGSTGSEGRVLLYGLPSGRCDYDVRHAEYAPVSGTVELTGGKTASVDVALSALGAVRGTLHDLRGSPLSGWQVQLRCPLPGYATDRRFGTVQVDGSFVVPVRKGLTYSVQVLEPGLDQLVQFEDPAGVTDASETLELVVGPNQRATAFMAGKLLDDAGQPALGGAAISLERHGRKLYPLADPPTAGRDDDSGVFRLGPLLPGKYRVRIRRPDGFQFAVEDVVLTAGGTTDLGPLTWPPSGDVTILVDVLPGASSGDIQAELSGNGVSYHVKIDPATRRGSSAMAPGDYKVAVFGGGFYARDGVIRVDVGQNAEYRVVLAPAIRVPFRLFVPEGEAGMTARLLEATGHEVFDFEIEAGASHDEWAPQLAVGAYRIEAMGSTGKAYAVEFEVETLEGTPVRRDLHLR